VIVIGAGIRRSLPLVITFEKILNVVRANAPRAKIAFNTNPTDTAAAVQRWAPLSE
jgi:hypothetical protein